LILHPAGPSVRRDLVIAAAPVLSWRIATSGRVRASAYPTTVNNWVRDVTFAEDLSQVRTGAAPQVMASLRNLGLPRHRCAMTCHRSSDVIHAKRYPC